LFTMKNNKLNWLIGIIIGIVFLILWLRIVDWSEFFDYLRNFELKKVLIFSIFYLLAYFLRSLRWKIILNPIKSINLWQIYLIFMQGVLINFLIPIRAGELTKSFILKVKYKIRVSDSLPTIFIDKLMDMFPIVLILVSIPLFSLRLNNMIFFIIVLLFLIFIILLVFLYFAVNHRVKAHNLITKLLSIFPSRYRSKIEGSFQNFIVGMSIMQKRTRDSMIVFFLTFLALISEALYIYIVFLSFGASASYQIILFGYTLMNLTYILPTPPGQIGSNQFMWVLIFSFALGINENLTSAAVTFSHLLTTILIMLIGIISFLALKINFRELVINNK